ncbi:MAG TPA: carbon-nitrogen hydrolase family protein [Candidatus Saccharimonadales bacterium]|jgi:predicted amidohydrolase|nr:carbon-nitrogen hydrolase family protein [Candidatus Saccharimonadales bacterium]
METYLTVALAQYPCDRDPAVTIQEAKSTGAEVVVFPEMYSNGYARFDPTDSAAVERWRNGAQTLDGTFIKKFREAARTSRMHVVATFLEIADPKPFNSALLIGPDGQIILHYRKVHICDFDSPEVECDRGKDFGVAEIQTTTGKITIGLMICMDREYPEAARTLSRAGAEIVLIPNCCDLATDRVVGDVRIAQMRGRAFENVLGIAIANYPAPRCDGHSIAIDPNGAVIAIADDAPGLMIARFDLQMIRKVRTDDQFRWRP